MTLNKEQALAKTKILTGGLHFLHAGGGRGKSYTTANIILDVLSDASNGNSVTVVAPSHTAKSVLESEIIAQSRNAMLPANISTMTVAAALGKIPDHSALPQSIKDTTFTLGDGGKLLGAIERGTFAMLVIEEVSMVGKSELIMMIRSWTERCQHPDYKTDMLILLCGDLNQIKPVKAVSPARVINDLKVDGQLTEHQLTINMRSGSGNDIGDYSESVLADLNGDYGLFNAGVFEYRNDNDFEAAYAKYVNTADTTNTTAIAYTNAKVNSYLKLANCENELPDRVDLKKGDFVRMHAAININFKNRAGSWETVTVVNNGDVVKVRSYECLTGGPDDIFSSAGFYTHPFSKKVKIEYAIVELDIINPDPQSHDHYVKSTICATISDSPNGGVESAYTRAFENILNVISRLCAELDSTVTLDDQAKTAGYKQDSEYVKKAMAVLFKFDPQLRTIWQNYEAKFKQGSVMCAKMKKKILSARCFYGERSKFANITTLDALTAHKSQGQSIDYVFADLRNIKKGELAAANSVDGDVVNGGFSLAYVACSRAKKELHVLY